MGKFKLGRIEWDSFNKLLKHVAQDIENNTSKPLIKPKQKTWWDNIENALWKRGFCNDAFMIKFCQISQRED